MFVKLFYLVKSIPNVFASGEHKYSSVTRPNLNT